MSQASTYRGRCLISMELLERAPARTKQALSPAPLVGSQKTLSNEGERF